jgi:hypothetical protein
MKPCMAVFGMFLFACSLLVGQTVSISDDSPAGSPVSIKGTVVFRDSLNAECSITGQNHGSISIIALVVELKLTMPSGEPGRMMFQRDHFFKPLTISLPKTDFIVTSDCQTGHELDIPRTPAAPEAHAKAIYMQFEDGSTWGDTKVGAALMGQRTGVLAFLKSLKTAYSSDGTAGLEKALAQDQKPGSMVWSKLAGLRMIRDASGISAVVETVDQNLATAEARKTLLK